MKKALASAAMAFILAACGQPAFDPDAFATSIATPDQGPGGAPHSATSTATPRSTLHKPIQSTAVPGSVSLLPTATPVPPTVTPQPSPTLPPPPAVLPPTPTPTRTPRPTATPVPATPTPSSGTFTLTSTADEPDAVPGDGRCAARSGACTLRAAVQEANALGGSIIITAPPGEYHLTLPAAAKDDNDGSDAAAGGDLDVTSSIVITGARSGSARTVIDGGRTEGGEGLRLFQVQPGARLQLDRLVLRHGFAGHESAGGGAILNRGTLLVANASITENYAMVAGGAIANLGVMELTDLSITLNGAFYSGGGGIANGQGARATLTRVSVSRNAAEHGTHGGGILNAGELTANDTTLSQNSGVKGGGVISSGTLRLTNATVTGNTAATGAGIALTGGSATIRGGSVTANTADAGAGGIAWEAGTLSLDSATNVSGNTPVDCTAPSGRTAPC